MLEHRAHSRRTLVLMAGFVAAALAAAGALAFRLSGSEGVVLTSQSSYTEGVSGTWQRVNPLFAPGNEVDADLSQLVFSGLVRLGPDGTVLPDLAGLPSIDQEGRTYTFKLRRDLHWHDGQQVTSSDVAFTVRLVTDPDFSGDQTLAEGWRGAQVETPDSSTFVVHLRQSSAPFLARSATVGILPEHLLSTTPVRELEDAPFNAHPIGTGPYRVESLDSREGRLTAYSDYHLGHPGIEHLTLRFYTDDASATRALQSGDVHGLLLRGSLSQGQLSDLQKVKDTEVSEPSRASQLLLYLNTTNTLFRDERVRRAISLGIDRGAIVSDALLGAATASVSPVAPGTWAYTKDYDNTAQDLSTARELLQQAGWVRSPGSGILTREGQEFRFTLRVDNDPVRFAIANDLARQLDALGIRAAVASTTFTVLNVDYLVPRRYEAALATWELGPDPDLYFAWHSSQMGAAGLNLANFEDPVTDELIAKGRTTNDVEVRKDSYRQLQEIWQDLVPGVIIAYPNAVYARTDAVQGTTDGVLFNGAARFVDVQKWHQ